MIALACGLQSPDDSPIRVIAKNIGCRGVHGNSEAKTMPMKRTEHEVNLKVMTLLTAYYAIRQTHVFQCKRVRREHSCHLGPPMDVGFS